MPLKRASQIRHPVVVLDRPSTTPFAPTVCAGWLAAETPDAGARHDLPMVESTAQTTSQRGLGGASIALGALGVLVAWLPVWSFAVVLLGPAALACALIGLLRRGPNSATLLVGIGLGVLAIAMFLSWPVLFLSR